MTTGGLDLASRSRDDNLRLPDASRYPEHQPYELLAVRHEARTTRRGTGNDTPDAEDDADPRKVGDRLEFAGFLASIGIDSISVAPEALPTVVAHLLKLAGR